MKVKSYSKISKSISIVCAILFTAIISYAQVRPTIQSAGGAQVRLRYKGKTNVVDLDDTTNVTLGGERRHRLKSIFMTVKDNNIYYLFQVQSGSPMSNPMGFCGGDSPLTLVWLKANARLKIEEANSEVFASCAYNGGRYQQGKIKIVGNSLRIGFEEKSKKFEITYDNKNPENSFKVREY